MVRPSWPSPRVPRSARLPRSSSPHERAGTRRVSAGGLWRWSAKCALALFFGPATLLAAGAATSVSPHRTIENAFIGPERRVHLHLANGREIVPAADSDQVDVESLLVALDSSAAGWLAVYPNSATSYPIPLELRVWSRGRMHRFTGLGLPVWKWRFVGAGGWVAFEQETVHGAMGVHYELRDVRTGRKRGDWEPGRGRAPSWAAALVPPDSL